MKRCDCDADGVNGRHRQHSALDGSPRPSSRVQRGAAASPAASGSPTSRTKDALSRSFQARHSESASQYSRTVLYSVLAVQSSPDTSLLTYSPTYLLTYSAQVLLFDDKDRQERHNAGRRPSLAQGGRQVGRRGDLRRPALLVLR